MKDNFDLYEWNKKRYLNNIQESDIQTEEKEYEVEYWRYTEDGYDNEYITVKAGSEEEALVKAKDQTRLGKKYSIYKG
jgi:hypothetical protein